MGPTVFDRMQKNGGFVTGPNHMFDRGQGDEQGGAPAQNEEVPSEVPNYRQADSPDMACRSCLHFDEQTSQCEKYAFVADPMSVCDSFTPEGAEGENADDSGQGMPPGMSNNMPPNTTA